MRKGIIVELSTADRARLEAVVADRNSPQKHVWRARIVLLTANGHGTALIMRQAGVSKVAVWRWQERFMTAGVEGLLRDNTSYGTPVELPYEALYMKSVTWTAKSPKPTDAGWPSGTCLRVRHQDEPAPRQGLTRPPTPPAGRSPKGTALMFARCQRISEARFPRGDVRPRG